MINVIIHNGVVQPISPGTYTLEQAQALLAQHQAGADFLASILPSYELIGAALSPMGLTGIKAKANEAAKFHNGVNGDVFKWDQANSCASAYWSSASAAGLGLAQMRNEVTRLGQVIGMLNEYIATLPPA